MFDEEEGGRRKNMVNGSAISWEASEISLSQTARVP
jgi:hypothetical protein